ncbi:MAG: hypothetical protein SNH94_06685 [Rikenellaceae bacterium]
MGASFGNLPTINLENCINSKISGNIYKGATPARIIVDEATAQSSDIAKKQKGFKE